MTDRGARASHISDDAHDAVDSDVFAVLGDFSREAAARKARKSDVLSALSSGIAHDISSAGRTAAALAAAATTTVRSSGALRVGGVASPSQAPLLPSGRAAASYGATAQHAQAAHTSLWARAAAVAAPAGSHTHHTSHAGFSFYNSAAAEADAQAEAADATTLARNATACASASCSNPLDQGRSAMEASGMLYPGIDVSHDEVDRFCRQLYTHWRVGGVTPAIVALATQLFIIFTVTCAVILLLGATDWSGLVECSKLQSCSGLSHYISFRHATHGRLFVCLLYGLVGGSYWLWTAYAGVSAAWQALHVSNFCASALNITNDAALRALEWDDVIQRLNAAAAHALDAARGEHIDAATAAAAVAAQAEAARLSLSWRVFYALVWRALRCADVDKSRTPPRLPLLTSPSHHSLQHARAVRALSPHDAQHGNDVVPTHSQLAASALLVAEIHRSAVANDAALDARQRDTPEAPVTSTVSRASPSFPPRPPIPPTHTHGRESSVHVQGGIALPSSGSPSIGAASPSPSTSASGPVLPFARYSASTASVGVAAPSTTASEPMRARGASVDSAGTTVVHADAAHASTTPSPPALLARPARANSGHGDHAAGTESVPSPGVRQLVDDAAGARTSSLATSMVHRTTMDALSRVLDGAVDGTRMLTGPPRGSEDAARSAPDAHSPVVSQSQPLFATVTSTAAPDADANVELLVTHQGGSRLVCPPRLVQSAASVVSSSAEMASRNSGKVLRENDADDASMSSTDASTDVISALEVAQRILRYDNYITAFACESLLPLSFPRMHTLCASRQNEYTASMGADTSPSASPTTSWRRVHRAQDMHSSSAERSVLLSAAPSARSHHGGGLEVPYASVTEWILLLLVVQPSWKLLHQPAAGAARTCAQPHNVVTTQRRVQLLAVLWLLALPFVLCYATLVLGTQHLGDAYVSKDIMGPREWSVYARRIVREYNELPHVLERRLAAASKPTRKFLQAAVSPYAASVGRGLTVPTAVLLGLILVAGAVNEDLVLHVTWGGRNLVWYAAVLGGLLSVARGIIPTAGGGIRNVRAADVHLRQMAEHTHYLPSAWVMDVVTFRSAYVRAQVAALFPNRLLSFARELAGCVAAPFYLLLVLSPNIARLLVAFDDFTHRDAQCGHVCTLCLPQPPEAATRRDSHLPPNAAPLSVAHEPLDFADGTRSVAQPNAGGERAAAPTALARAQTAKRVDVDKWHRSILAFVAEHPRHAVPFIATHALPASMAMSVPALTDSVFRSVHALRGRGDSDLAARAAPAAAAPGLDASYYATQDDVDAIDWERGDYSAFLRAEQRRWFRAQLTHAMLQPFERAADAAARKLRDLPDLVTAVMDADALRAVGTQLDGGGGGGGGGGGV